MTAAKTALVVGGGVAGMSCAIMMRRAGIEVSLMDLDPQWRVAGAGITITAPTLRAFKAIGILDRVVEEGHTHEGIRVCRMDGKPTEELRSPPLDVDVPGAGGILRPVLHRILSDRTKALGTDVKLGATIRSLEQDGDGVSVRFTDGTNGRYEVVIGSDGIHSKMRELLFPDAPVPQFTGQACWRLVTARPSEIDRRHFFLGGPVKVGLTPVSKDEMYLFLLEPIPGNPWREPREHHVLLGKLLEGYGGILAPVREGLSENSRIVYRPLKGHILRRDWFRGRAILLGDAAHASTPQLASGAGMAAEDGIVLADELRRSSTVQEAFRGFMKRRYERCRLVVENSIEIGRLETAKSPPELQTSIVAQSLRALAAPI